MLRRRPDCCALLSQQWHGTSVRPPTQGQTTPDPRHQHKTRPPWLLLSQIPPDRVNSAGLEELHE